MPMVYAGVLAVEFFAMTGGFGKSPILGGWSTKVVILPKKHLGLHSESFSVSV